jgi:hypothetical protein
MRARLAILLMTVFFALLLGGWSYLAPGFRYQQEQAHWCELHHCGGQMLP